jgi:acyl-CoA thioesterase-2
MDDAVRETLELVAVRPDGDGWIGDTPTWFGEYLFGGWVVAQAVHAATRGAPEGRRIHSLHAYFLRPVRGGATVSYRLQPLREGRTFSLIALSATQDDRPVLSMMASFTADTEGYEYELASETEQPSLESIETGEGPGAWVAGWIGPTEPRPDGTRRSTHRHWFRIPDELPDDPHLHAALLGFATDWTGTGGRPLHLEGDVTGMVSLDHAVWFHRPARADEWLFYDVHSLINTGGRGLLRGAMRRSNGELVISVAQEMMLRPVTE